MNQAAAKNDAMRAIVLHFAPATSVSKSARGPKPDREPGPGPRGPRSACAAPTCPRMLVKGAWKMPPHHRPRICRPYQRIGEGGRGWDMGELVAIAPLLPPWRGNAASAGTGNYSRCVDYDYFGSPSRNGAMPEYVAVPVENPDQGAGSISMRAPSP